jgi:hypothetical protein
MSKKTSAFFFIAGAVAGWTAAQRAIGDPWAQQSLDAAPAPIDTLTHKQDPFRDQFEETRTRVILHNATEDQSEVA